LELLLYLIVLDFFREEKIPLTQVLLLTAGKAQLLLPKEKAEKLKKILEKKSSKVFLIKADLNKISELNKIIKFANVKMKGVNCLINNASLFENDNIKNFSDVFINSDIENFLEKKENFV